MNLLDQDTYTLDCSLPSNLVKGARQVAAPPPPPPPHQASADAYPVEQWHQLCVTVRLSRKVD